MLVVWKRQKLFFFFEVAISVISFYVALVLSSNCMLCFNEKKMLLTRASQTILSGSDFTPSHRPAAWSCGSDHRWLSLKGL